MGALGALCLSCLGQCFLFVGIPKDLLLAAMDFISDVGEKNNPSLGDCA